MSKTIRHFWFCFITRYVCRFLLLLLAQAIWIDLKYHICDGDDDGYLDEGTSRANLWHMHISLKQAGSDSESVLRIFISGYIHSTFINWDDLSCCKLFLSCDSTEFIFHANFGHISRKRQKVYRFWPQCAMNFNENWLESQSKQ